MEPTKYVIFDPRTGARNFIQGMDLKDAETAAESLYPGWKVVRPSESGTTEIVDP